MKGTKQTLRLFLFIFGLFSGSILWAQRPMDKLDRSVVALKTNSGVYINWRIPSEEWYNVAYNLYRDGVKVNASPITGASNFLDAAGTATSKYTVTAVKNGVESASSKVGTVLNNPYWEVKMRSFPGDSLYHLNDATAADLDGDGEYEIIVKRLNSDYENLTTDKFSYLEAYKLDGTFMWAIDVGPNIVNDVEINVMAYDFDGDGKAEVLARSSEGTIDGEGNKIGDTDGDSITNYRSVGIRINSSPYMIAGPEFLSLYDGVTGKELDRVNFIGREPLVQWGSAGMSESQLAHRSNKYFFGAPYLDGKHPSVFTGRGIYHQTKFQTYDVVNKKLVERWSFASGTSGDYYGQGNHNYTIADVDNDGRDEITWGSMCVDDNGQGLYSTRMGHGDAIHVGDFDPYHKGTEVFSCLENSPVFGTLLREASTGKTLHHYIKGSDCGRACAGNITDAYKGAEMWGGGFGYSATDLVSLKHFGVAENYVVYWDGDLLQEICDHRGFTTTNGVGLGTITKFKDYGQIDTLLKAEGYSCNWSKGTPNLQADIIGDWREEVIWRSTDNKALRIYVTPYETQHRIYSLMHDHQYRQAIAWQMCGYNQPPHVSYFLGDTYTTPPPAVSTNGKLVWTGSTSEWSSTAANWTSDEAAASYEDGKQVLFDVSASNKTVELSGTLHPEALTVSGPMDYTIAGSGSLAGNMRLNKLGAGSLVLNGNHSYAGPTEVWEGNLSVSDTLSSSAVWVNRFATLGAKGKLAQGVTMEFGSVLYAGGNKMADSLIIGNSLTLKDGSVLEMDLSVNPTATANAKQNDIILTGNLVLGSNLTLQINAAEVSAGDYVLVKLTGTLTGSLSNFTVQGIVGKKIMLVFENNQVILRLEDTRAPGSIVWDGGSNGVWDVSATPNFLNNGAADIFVYQDSVTFNNEGKQKAVNMIGNLAPSSIKIDNDSLNAYTFDGKGIITGTGFLYKTNIGTATINSRNDYSGKTIIDGGTLEVKFAPSSTNSGGIGINDTVPANLVISNGATLKILTAKETTDRGLTLGIGGGKLDVPAQLTWSGRIVGSSLVKQDSGLLIINANNSALEQSVVNGGIVRLGTENSEIYGLGKKVTLNAGSIEFLNNVSSYSRSNFDVDVPSGATGKLVLDGRCDYYGALTGAGTLNLVIDYVRGTHFGNWSAFEGQINVTANSANSKYGDDFRVNNTYGYPASSVNLGDKVSAYYSAAVTSGVTIHIGELSGTSTSSLAGGPTASIPLTWNIGAKNTNAVFNGIIKEQTATSVTAITKVGNGSWTLTNANTYKGETNVKAGTLVVKNIIGSATGTGVVNVDSLGTLAGNGIIAGALNIKNGGTLTPGITESDSLAIDTLTIQNAVTFSPNGILNIDINATTSGADLLVASGTVTLDGALNLTNLGEPVITGDSFKIVSASVIKGSFSSISPVEPSATTKWDFKTFNTDGILRVADYLPQTVVLNFTDKTYGDADFPAEGVASSGLPLTYSIDNPSVATVSADGIIHIVGAGTCTVTASQAGSENYRPVVASKSLTVAKTNLIINFALIAPKTYGDEPSVLKISSNGNETPIVISSMNSKVATVSDSTLTINGAGFSILTVSQAGNSNYNEATKVYRILLVKKAMITATAADTSRNINKPNPEFRITYSGFAGNDDIYSLNWLPIASCNAKKNSPAGTYEIKVLGGYDDNYYFNYVSGILTIVDPSKGSPFAADVRMYPNPTQDMVNIDLRKNMDNITVEVYTSTGRKVTSVKKSGNLLSLDLSGYPNGLYTIRLISGKNVVCKPVLKN